jgi:addiction module RelE/StbE family toxin
VKIIWIPEAISDRLDIWNYIALNNPIAASQLDELFSAAAFKLATLPRLGHEGRILGTFELIPHENYRLIYEIKNEAVWILVLVHTSRQWPFPSIDLGAD